MFDTVQIELLRSYLHFTWILVLVEEPVATQEIGQSQYKRVLNENRHWTMTDEQWRWQNENSDREKMKMTEKQWKQNERWQLTTSELARRKGINFELTVKMN